MPHDRIFTSKVPRARVLKKDIKKAGIPFIDESGRRADDWPGRGGGKASSVESNDKSKFDQRRKVSGSILK